jgi:hypothetical protein
MLNNKFRFGKMNIVIEDVIKYNDNPISVNSL